MGSVTYETLEHVAMQARPYPTHLLEGCETGLCLFAAAFLGHNDAVHMAEAGLRVTCVDIDNERLMEMRRIYTDDLWKWAVFDAWEFAEWSHGNKHRWDAVSVDTFTGDAMRRSLDSLDLWCSLARKAITVTHVNGEPYQAPEGWRSSLFERTIDVNWLVLERDA